MNMTETELLIEYMSDLKTMRAKLAEDVLQSIAKTQQLDARCREIDGCIEKLVARMKEPTNEH